MKINFMDQNAGSEKGAYVNPKTGPETDFYYEKGAYVNPKTGPETGNNTKNDSIKINIDDISKIANELSRERDAIHDIFKANVLPALESSAECLQVAGLDSQNIYDTFKNLETNIENEISKLVDVLRNDVTKSYQELMSSVSRYFNQDLASQLSSLLYFEGPLSNINNGNQTKF